MDKKDMELLLRADKAYRDADGLNKPDVRNRHTIRTLAEIEADKEVDAALIVFFAAMFMVVAILAMVGAI